MAAPSLNVQDMEIEDLLKLLDCPQKEVSEEVKTILKKVFRKVNQNWLVSGLLDYFFATNSSRMLEVLVNAPEPHDKYLMDRISDGLRGPDKFRYTCILFYAVRQKLPPMWLKKLPRHAVMRVLLHTLQHCPDATVLLSGIMVLVVILPIVPFEMSNDHLPSILDIFWNMVQWSPAESQDSTLKPYMQVAVYSLFHRLYALYPCNLLNFMRNNTKDHKKLYFLTTLRPMLEHVRLHPLLVSDTNESETIQARWLGLQPHQLLHECSKLCLDPLESTCEESPWSWLPVSSRSDNTMDHTPEPSSLLLCQSDNNFWSPGIVQSPVTHTSSIPHTPVYGLLTPHNTTVTPHTSKTADSPPEAAIEATPETTPFTSPLKMENRQSTAIRSLKLVTPENSNQNRESNDCPTSPLKKEIFSMFSESKRKDIFSKVEKSTILQNKLQQIQLERQQSQENQMMQNNLDSNNDKYRRSTERSESTVSLPLENVTSSNQEDPRRRRRKVSVFANENLKFMQSMDIPPPQIDPAKPLPYFTTPDIEAPKPLPYYNMPDIEPAKPLPYYNIPQIDPAKPLLEEESKDTELSFAETSEKTLKRFCPNEMIIDRRISEEKDQSSDGSRKDSIVSSEEQRDETSGIGVPTPRSMKDFLSNIRTNRLRFLSQCAAPPDISCLSGYSIGGPTSPCKSDDSDSKPIQRSNSCPNLKHLDEIYNNFSSLRRKKYSSTGLSFTLSPTKPLVGPLIEKCDSYTQTEDTSVINPYEQLLEALLPPAKMKMNDCDDQSETYSEAQSPHQLLNNYVRQIIHPDNRVMQHYSSNSELDVSPCELKRHLDAMHTLLLFERHKREVHAERNRRLLSKAKSMYILKEKENEYLREIGELQNQVSSLNTDLMKMQKKYDSQQQVLQSAKKEQNDVIMNMKDEVVNVKQQQKLLKERNVYILNKNAELQGKLQCTESLLLDSNRQLKEQNKLTEENIYLRNQIESLQKHNILLGELQERSEDELWQLQMSDDTISNSDLEMERTAAVNEIQSLKEENRTANSSVRALMYRVKELEKLLQEKDKLLIKRQNAIQETAEIGVEQCKVVERRCQILSTTNRALESQIMQMHQKLDILSRQVRATHGNRTFTENLDSDFDISNSPTSRTTNEFYSIMPGTRIPNSRHQSTTNKDFVVPKSSFIYKNQSENLVRLPDMVDKGDGRQRKNT